MKAEQNELITRIGPGTACGAVMRHYWQPVVVIQLSPIGTFNSFFNMGDVRVCPVN